MTASKTTDDLLAPTFDFDRKAVRKERGRRLVATIVCHPDLERIGERAHLRAGGSEPVGICRGEPAFGPPGGDATEPLRDRFLSRRPVFSVSGTAKGATVTIEQENAAIQIEGADGKSSVRLSEAALEAGVVVTIRDRIGLLIHAVRSDTPSWMEPMGLVGESDAIVALREAIARIGPTTGNVLVHGETGSGKELVARAIHRASARAARVLVGVNMGALSEGLIASALFGHVRGTFSGAVDSRKGCFRSADGSTLFMDEIGEAPPEVQRMLLRVLETREVQPVGSDRSFPVDVRLISATDADLDAAIREKAFRGPLYHRIAEHVVAVPPLSARKDDVARLAAHFIREQLRELGREVPKPAIDDPTPWLPASVITAFLDWRWPGNVRELRNRVRAMVVGATGAQPLALDPRFVDEMASRPAEPTAQAPDLAQLPDRSDPRHLTEAQLLEALRANQYRRGPTAKMLGISRSSLYTLIKGFPGIREVGDLTPTDIEAAAAAHDSDHAAMADALGVSPRGLTLRMRELGLG